MRLRSFYAKTVKEAMETVRDTLGPEAVIVATRDDPRGGGVHVTAARDDHPLPQDARGRAVEDWLQYDTERDIPSVEETLTEAMLFHAVPEAVMDEVISCASVSGHGAAEAALAEALTHLFFFDRLPAGAHARPLVLVGPPGSGKTTAVARLATRAALAGLRPAVITTDVTRAGAAAQLAAFTKILDAPLLTAESAKAVAGRIAEAQAAGADQILIDTAGANPFLAEDMREIASIAKAAQGDTILTLAAGVDAAEAGEAAQIFAAAGARRFLPTRLDGARRMGTLLAAAQRGGVTFVGASITPNVADAPLPLDAATLSALLIRGVGAVAPPRAQATKKTREGVT